MESPRIALNFAPFPHHIRGMSKDEVAEILINIGTLLELKGENPFKTRAYHNAARTLEGLAEPLEKIVAEQRLGEIKGFGDALVDKITQLVTTGKLPYYDELKASVAPGLVEMLGIPSLGPKKVKKLHDELGVDTIDALAADAASTSASSARRAPSTSAAACASRVCSAPISLHSPARGASFSSSLTCQATCSRSLLRAAAFASWSTRARASFCHSRKQPATSRASGSSPAWASTISRCASVRSSDWCACCPWISTSCSPASRNCASVAACPLMKARERPPRSSTRRNSTASAAIAALIPITRGRNACRRPNASNCRTSAAPRPAAPCHALPSRRPDHHRNRLRELAKFFEALREREEHVNRRTLVRVVFDFGVGQRFLRAIVSNEGVRAVR